jgi:hypothetical protein
MPRKSKEARSAYNKEYYGKHRAERCFREHTRYHQEGAKERQTANRLGNLARYAEYQRDNRFRRPQHALINQAKSRAKKAGLPFNLSVETMEWPIHCPILGLELDYNKNAPGSRKLRVSVATLDRKVNELGYVLGNVFVLSHRANRIKSDATLAELKAIVAYMESRP